MTIFKDKSLLFILSISLNIAPCANAETKYVPMPNKEVLRNIQEQAYICSQNNDVEACNKTRELADPLMDHPRLPYACKDTIWELIQMAKHSDLNSFIRRDSIDLPARRLSIICKSNKKNKNPSMLRTMPKRSTKT